MTAAKKTANDDVKVTVEVPFQVAFAGVVYMPGDTVTIPVAVADEWRRSGWVD